MSKLRSLFLGVVVAFISLAGVGSAQTLSPVSGNGQLICPLCPNGVGQFAPMVVVVKDANGNPLANQTVSWALTSGEGFVNAGTTTTGANGTTSNVVVLSVPLLNTGQSYAQGVVRASIGASIVTFTETMALTASQGVQQVFPQLVSPALGTTYSGAVGTAVTPVVKVVINALNGTPVPGVEVRLDAPDPTQGPSITCQSVSGLAPGTILTDSTGSATCTPMLTGKQGTGQFSILIGSNFRYPSSGGFSFTVTNGPPAAMKIISGNNQSGKPGAPLAGVLIAEVDDLAGNALPNVNVAWDVIQGTATLSQTQTTTDSTGKTSTGVTLGATAGPVQVRVRVASNASVAATFTATANLVISGLSKLSGDAQTAIVNTPFALPLVVQVTNAAQGVPGAPVIFAVTSGSATVTTATATTDTQGNASTNVQAGATAGPVVVTATTTTTTGSYSQTFNLTVTPAGPSITSDSFYNAAGFQKGFLSPCSLATIVAPGLAPGVQGALVPTFFGPLPYVVANISVRFGNSYAPIYSVVNGYKPGMDAVTVEVPCELTAGTTAVTVRVGVDSTTVNIPLLVASPGIFETVMSDNVKRAVLTRPDGSFVDVNNPARRGEIIRVFVTGLGPVSPAVGTNQTGIEGVDMEVSNTVVVGVNNSGVRVVGAKYAQNLIGVYEVEFQVPSDTPTGNSAPFAVAVQQGNSLVFGNPSMIPVQ